MRGVCTDIIAGRYFPMVFNSIFVGCFRTEDVSAAGYYVDVIGHKILSTPLGKKSSWQNRTECST